MCGRICIFLRRISSSRAKSFLIALLLVFLGGDLLASSARNHGINNSEPQLSLAPLPTMASVGTLSLFFPVFVPASAALAAYLGHRSLYVDWRAWLRKFLTGPGRTSRILLVFFVLTNWKSMPLGWTVSALPPSPHKHAPSLQKG